MQYLTKNTIRKTSPFFALIMASFLAACGGGGSGGHGSSQGVQDQSNNTAETAPLVRLVDVKGTVNKGIVSNGLVSVYAIENGETGRLLANAYTDLYGQFTATLRNYEGPVYVEVTAASGANPTMMICDAYNGCGDGINFGDSFPVSNDFRLTTVLPSNYLTAQTAISPLTHLAAQYAAQLPQGMNDISIAVAMAQVQNTFGLQTSLLNVKSVDITNSSAVSSASESELRHAMLAAAIMGLADHETFSANLSNLTQAFNRLNGRLPSNSDDGSISLLDLVEQALILAGYLGQNNLLDEFDTLADQLNDPTLDNQAPVQQSNDPIELAKAKAFIADLKLWQDHLDLMPNQTPFKPIIDAMGSSTSKDMATMLQALAIAGQYGPIIALPDLALGAACDSLGGLAGVTCRLLVGNKTLEQICNMAGTGLTINGRSLCEVLNDLVLPLGKNLRGHFALYDGRVRIYGTLNNAEVDLTFARNGQNSNQYGFSVSGGMDTPTGSLHINSGNVTLAFDSALDVRNLKLPETAIGAINVRYQQWSDDDSAGMEFNGNLNLNMDLRANRNGQPQMKLTAAGLFASGTNSFSGSLLMEGGSNSLVTAKFATQLSDYSEAELTLIADPAKLANGEVGSLRLAWAGKEYNILGLSGEFAGLRILNQNGLMMDLNLEAGAGEDNVFGYLQLYGQGLAKIVADDGEWVFQLNDETEAFL